MRIEGKVLNVLHSNGSKFFVFVIQKKDNTVAKIEIEESELPISVMRFIYKNKNVKIEHTTKTFFWGLLKSHPIISSISIAV